jgi:hypothetical protein
MRTNWNLVREMMNAGIDACERIEATGFDEFDRDATVNVNGQPVSVHDLLISAWTYPENIRYQVIRERHDQNVNLDYVPETARILTALAQVGAELIKAGDMAQVESSVQKMVQWFQSHASPSIEQAIADRRNLKQD